MGLPTWHSGKEFTCQCRRHRDTGSIPGLVRSPGVGNDNPVQYSCLENSLDRGAGGLQSTGPQRVGYDWATEHQSKTSCPTAGCLWIQFLSGAFCGFLRVKVIFFRELWNCLPNKSSWAPTRSRGKVILFISSSILILCVKWTQRPVTMSPFEIII